MPRIHEVKRDRANKRMELNEAKALVRTKKADLRTKADEMPPDQEIPAEDVDALSALQARVDVLEAEAGALDARVSQLEMFQESDADEAVEIDQIDQPGSQVDASFRGSVQRGIGDNSGRIVSYGHNEPQRQNVKGAFVARMMIGKAWVKMGMSFDKAAAEMERRFNDKAVAKALNTAGTATGGALIPQDYVAEIIDLLRASSVIRSLQPRFLDMPRGNLTIPRLASAATANYQGELDAAQVSQQGFDTVQLNAKKLTALVPVTNDLIRRTPLGVEQVITNDLNRVAGLREDLAFILADGSQGTPVGLYNQCAATQRLTIPAFTALDNATISSATIGAANAMKLTLKNAMSGMIRPAWIMSAVTEAFLRGVRDGVGNFIYKNEMDGGKFEGVRFAVTQQIPTNINTGTTQSPVNNGAFLIMVDMANVIVADTMNYELDVFDQATYVTSGVTVSAVQMDQTVFRVIQEHDLAMEHQGSLAVALLPGWAPAGFSAFSSGQNYYNQPLNNDQSAAPSTWGAAAPTGSNNPANIAANVAGGQQPGRPQFSVAPQRTGRRFSPERSPSMPETSHTSAATVAISSAEFEAAVAKAVAAAMATQVIPQPQIVTVAAAPVIQPTSIDATKPGHDDLTIAFTRFCTFQGSGYQRGQMAGFVRKAAYQAIAGGSAVLVHDPRIHDEIRANRAA